MDVFVTTGEYTTFYSDPYVSMHVFAISSMLSQHVSSQCCLSLALVAGQSLIDRLATGSHMREGVR